MFSELLKYLLFLNDGPQNRSDPTRPEMQQKYYIFAGGKERLVAAKHMQLVSTQCYQKVCWCMTSSSCLLYRFPVLNDIGKRVGAQKTTLTILQLSIVLEKMQNLQPSICK